MPKKISAQLRDENINNVENGFVIKWNNRDFWLPLPNATQFDFHGQ